MKKFLGWMSVGAVFFLASLFSLCAVGEAISLTIGQESGNSQFPVYGVNTEDSGFVLKARMLSTSPLRPSAGVKMKTLAEMPDIMPVYAGFFDNDLAYYVDRDLLEPLDSFFAELGLSVEEVIPESLLSAVRYKGKIWALPNRMNCFVMSYEETVLKRLGLKDSFDSWASLMAAGERISKEAVADQQVMGVRGKLSREDMVSAFFLWHNYALQPENMPETSLATLLLDYYARGVFGPEDAVHTSSFSEHAFTLQMAQDVASTQGKRVMPVPDRVNSEDSTALPHLVFLESFALKRNTSEKVAAGRSFLSWLLQIETQLAILEYDSAFYAYHHVPALRTVFENEKFRKACVTLQPDGKRLWESLKNVYVTKADPNSFRAQRQAIVARIKESEEAKRRGSKIEAYLLLMQPLPFTEPDGTTQSVTSFDAY